MIKYKSHNEISFMEREFPVIKLDKCCITEYNPSQSDTISATKSNCFIIVKDGKGSITVGNSRNTITKSVGLVLKHGETAKIKADGIEPITAITIYISQNDADSFVSQIKEKENGNFLNFGTNQKICDSANDLITECSKQYSTDYSIMLCFYEFINSINEHYTEKKNKTKNVYMTRAIDYIKQNYNKNISVEAIANLLGIERSYLSRLFKTYKNKSTQNYIIDYRMYKAKRMFEEEDLNVSQVCAAVGYTNIYCFSRIFKSRVGMPPKEYMEKCKK